MTDRTSISITMATLDLEEARRLLLSTDWRGQQQEFAQETTNTDGTVTVVRDGVTEGGERDAEELEAAGIPFVMHHQASWSFPEAFTAYDGDVRDHCIACEGELILTFDETTNAPREEDIMHARAFADLKRRALQRMRERDSARSLYPSRLPDLLRERA